jgi:non-heme Fe2+,alpha-ketoglutarate-dependent halogenase
MYVGKPWPIALPLRCLAVTGVAAVALRRRLRIPRSLLLLRKLRRIDEHWTDAMIRDFVRSFGGRLPIDQPCRLQAPSDPNPRVDVPAPHRLAVRDVQGFYERGFLPPFPAVDAATADRLRECVLARRTEPSEVYGFVTDRDRHLDTPALLELMRSPAITDRLAQLLGPDLVSWRSQIFAKPPGGGPIQWHQASTYMMEDNFLEPVLVPPDRDRLFQLTVWIALGPVTAAHGCLRFLPGTHDRMHTMRLGNTGGGFYAARYELECDVDPERVVEIEMDAGEALIFCERTVHGSGPNTTDEPRVGFNYRVVTPAVDVYPGGKRWHTAVHMGERYDLQRWHPVALGGAPA